MRADVEKIKEFAKECSEKYGVKVGVCENSPSFFHSELRELCEANSCGLYGRCHTCPPNTGTAEECIKKAQSYKNVMVFCKIYELEDSYDFYGMVEAKKFFVSVEHGIADDVKDTFEGCFALGAGGCGLCEECTAKEGKPCRFPKRALSSLEAYCIQVSELASAVGLKYINGQDTVTYFGAVFF